MAGSLGGPEGTAALSGEPGIDPIESRSEGRCCAPWSLVRTAIAIGLLQIVVVVAGVVWIERLGLRGGIPEAIARRRALGAVVLILAPWTPIVTVWLHSLGQRSRPWRSWLFGSGAAQGVSAATLLALVAVRGVWGLDPEVSPALGVGLIFFGLLALAASGWFLFLDGFLRPEGSLVATLALVGFLTGTIFFADAFITEAGSEDRPFRIDLLLGANPLLAVCGPVAGIDLLRTETLYSISSIGPYYPYRYPDLSRSRNRYLAVFAVGLLLRVVLEAFRRALRGGKDRSAANS